MGAFQSLVAFNENAEGRASALSVRHGVAEGDGMLEGPRGMIMRIRDVVECCSRGLYERLSVRLENTEDIDPI